MKIAFISIVKDPWGGSEVLWGKTAEYAMIQGDEVFISAYDQGKLSHQFSSLVEKGATIFLRRGFIKSGTGLYKRVIKKAIFFLLNILFNPYKKIINQNPDIVVYTGSCYSIKDDMSLIDLLILKQIPLIINTQVNWEYSRPISELEAVNIKKAYNYASKVTFVSERNVQVAKRHLIDEIKNALVVRNPVNLNSIELIKYPPIEGKIKFAMVANLLVNHKGHDLILDVLHSAYWKDRNWELNIYGAGNDEKYIKKLTAFWGLDSKVNFKGKSNNIRQIWEENHMLVMPSLCEGIPLAVVEAMICGRPVLATDTGGHMEWIDDGISGFIAEGANVYSISVAMERAWSNMANWQKIGENAHKKAMTLYDPCPEKTYYNLIKQYGASS